MSRALVLGIDGGGTSTKAWLAEDPGPVIGRGQAGPSNVKSIGPEAARAALDLAISRSFDDAGLGRCPVDVACLGLAGFDRPAEKQLLEKWSDDCGWAHRLVLVNDGDLVVAAGTLDGWGVGVIAGTGSIAVGRSKTGQSARSGGWGYLIGDEGSGYAVALAGLRKVARRADGRESPPKPDPLTSRICEQFAIADPSGLVAALYRTDFDRARIAGLAPIVVEASRADRSIFTEILEPSGIELARMVVAVAHQIGIDQGPLPLAKAGSFLLKCSEVSRVLDDQLGLQGFEVHSQVVTDPAEGAIILARRAFFS